MGWICPFSVKPCYWQVHSSQTFQSFQFRSLSSERKLEEATWDIQMLAHFQSSGILPTFHGFDRHKFVYLFPCLVTAGSKSTEPQSLTWLKTTRDNISKMFSLPSVSRPPSSADSACSFSFQRSSLLTVNTEIKWDQNKRDTIWHVATNDRCHIYLLKQTTNLEIRVKKERVTVEKILIILLWCKHFPLFCHKLDITHWLLPQLLISGLILIHGVGTEGLEYNNHLPLQARHASWAKSVSV